MFSVAFADFRSFPVHPRRTLPLSLRPASSGTRRRCERRGQARAAVGSSSAYQPTSRVSLLTLGCASGSRGRHRNTNWYRCVVRARAAEARVVHAHQRHWLDGEPGLLPGLAAGRRSWRLADLEPATGHGPELVVLALDQQDLAALVENGSIADGVGRDMATCRRDRAARSWRRRACPARRRSRPRSAGCAASAAWHRGRRAASAVPSLAIARSSSAHRRSRCSMPLLHKKAPTH